MTVGIFMNLDSWYVQCLFRSEFKICVRKTKSMCKERALEQFIL